MPTQTLTFEEAYEKLLEIVERGDEKKAKNFLVEHLSEFPEEMQNKITFALFEEAALDRAEGEKTLHEFEKEGLENLDILKKLKGDLEKDQKIQKIKSGLGI